MSRKMMLLVLAVASIAMFALQATGSAQEIHWTNTQEATGTGGASTLAASEEPTITCEKWHVTERYTTGGTTGTTHADGTGCHVTIGFTFKCHTSGSPLDNTITTSGTYHLITRGFGFLKPHKNLTLAKVTVICAGISNTIVTGNLIGTITSPACGGESKTTTTAYSSTGSTQNHLDYTGVNYDLLAETEGSGKSRTAGFTVTTTTEQAAAGKLECT